jgi:L-lactate utilization protein LutC
MATVKRPIKKAVNGTTTTKSTLDPKSRELIVKQFKENQIKKDSTYEANTKSNLEKSIKDLALKAQQKQLEENRKAKLPRQKNGGSVAKAKDGKWMQKAAASIKRRGTEGKCTPITKPGCTGKAKTLAKTFKKIAKSNKKK